MLANLTNQTYRQLCTEFYDISKPRASEEEVNFYKARLNDLNQPVLEAMCGSGRLLIPLAEAGVKVDGVDNSPYMLASCRQRLLEHLTVNLYEQSLQTMQLPNRYSAIIIAVGSFQLITNREEANLALQNLKSHLMPGGKLLINTFIPWGALSMDEEPSTHEINASNGNIIKNTCHYKVNKIEQYYDSHFIYEKIKNGDVMQTEQEQMRICWYYKYEFAMLLELAGLHSIKMYDTNFEVNPGSLVYEVVA